MNDSFVTIPVIDENASYLHNKWSEVETMKVRYLEFSGTHADLLQWATFRIFIFGIVADVVVAVSMCFILARLRSGITQ